MTTRGNGQKRRWCIFCGMRCYGVTCWAHADLPVDEADHFPQNAGHLSTSLAPQADLLYVPPMQAAATGEAAQADREQASC